jgi:hypothetical protein
MTYQSNSIHIAHVADILHRDYYPRDYDAAARRAARLLRTYRSLQRIVADYDAGKADTDELTVHVMACEGGGSEFT